MAGIYPENPILNQQVIVGGKTMQWNGFVWKVIGGGGAGGGGGNSIVISQSDPFPNPASVPEGTEVTVRETFKTYKLIDGAWVEDGNVGDEVDVRAASYMTLAEAQASDLRVGQFVRLTDRGLGLWKLAPHGVASDEFFNLAVNSGVLEYQLAPNGVINVLHAGAVNGTDTDSRAAFQACLDYRAYSCVELPASSVFKIAGTLVNNTQFSIKGAEGGSAAFQSSRIYHDPTSTGPLFEVSNSTNGAYISNLFIYGGNGSPCIQSDIPQVRYEWIYMSDYNGGGVALRGQQAGGAIGTSTARLKGIQWTAPATATSYTGFSINANGGDVVLENCIAIRGARGFSIRAGQTIQLLNCQANKQSTYNGFSSLPDEDTYGVGIAGTDPKEVVTIRGGYYEACTNLIVVAGGELVEIDGCLLADIGVAGVIGAYEAFNHMIDVRLGNQVSITNNKWKCTSNGKQSTSQAFYPLNISNQATQVSVKKNNFEISGTYSAQYNVQSKVDWEDNIVVSAPSVPAPDVGEELLNISNKKYDAAVKFNGVGGVSISHQDNIVSVVRDSVGEYTITTRLGYDNPLLQATGENASVVRTLICSASGSGNTYKVFTGSDVTTPVDARNLNFILIEDRG